jgi:hypothetical protein
MVPARQPLISGSETCLRIGTYGAAGPLAVCLERLLM